jgi:hypothetical protein
MDSRAREVLKIGDGVFGRKRTVDRMWQEIALHFYPERADFTTKRNDGDEFGDHLFSSYPVLARRELANLFSAKLRPKDQRWGNIHLNNEELDNRQDIRAYLEYMSDIWWRAIYDPDSGFVRATKQTDHDYASFGNGVVQITPNIAGDGLLHRNHHLRDCAWAENAEGRVDHLHREWNPTARQLVGHFGDKVSKEVMKAYGKDPEKTFGCRHVVMPSRLYHNKPTGNREFPFTSFYVERDSETVLEEAGLSYFCYVVARWETIDGSPYARSPATEIALPDGRTLQVIVRVLREAGEKHVDPPMLAVFDAIRSDIDLASGGITNVDWDYDEKLGEVLRPVTRDKSGFPIGAELAAALREDIRAAFFLDKITLPELGNKMTAFEVRRRMMEHIQAATPLWEPIEVGYNAPLSETELHILMEGGAFGPPEWMPDELRDGAEVEFKFRSPLTDMTEANEAEVFIDGMARVYGPLAEVDPALLAHVNLDKASRDAVRSIGWKAEWLNPEEAVDQERERVAAQAEADKATAEIGAAAEIVQRGGQGIKSLAEAEAGAGGQGPAR